MYKHKTLSEFGYPMAIQIRYIILNNNDNNSEELK